MAVAHTPAPMPATHRRRSWRTDAVAFAVGYACGSVPVGLWLGRAVRGLDVREHGSGSTGATNVLRIAGPAAAASTFALDVAKGAAAVRAAQALGAGGSGQVAAGLGAVVGHSWPALARFRGGKSVATAFGGLLVLAPELAPPTVIAGVSALAVTRTVSVGSLTATLWAAATAVTRRHPSAAAAYTVGAAALIVHRHRANLRRLAEGHEPRLGRRRGS